MGLGADRRTKDERKEKGEGEKWRRKSVNLAFILMKTEVPEFCFTTKSRSLSGEE
jgi:hypothetical protein